MHSQRLYELSKIHFRDFVVSHWLLRVLGYPVDPQPEAEVGLPYIHGVEPRERALHRPLLNFEGGTIIVGTTQSGKGVTLSVLASQAVYRGDVVIIIDPKNSKRLKGNVIRACQDRRPGRGVCRIPSCLSRTGRALRSHVQLAEADRAGLAHPVGHAP